jgi:hypothetical protein
MPKAHADWKVLDHGPLEQLADNLFRVEGAVPGMSLRRVMTVVRRGDGSVLVHNPIALDDTRRQQLEALGALAVIVTPSAVHRLDTPAFKSRYPGAAVFCPSGARHKVAQVVSVDGSYEDYADDGVVRFEMLDGLAGAEGAMIVQSSDGASVVLNDVVMNMDTRKDVLGYLFTTLLGSAPGPRVSRLAKWALVKDQGALRAHLERLAALPDLTRLIVSHDKLASGAEAAAALREAASYLAPRA